MQAKLSVLAIEDSGIDVEILATNWMTTAFPFQKTQAYSEEAQFMLLAIIDVLEKPQLAEDERILATPTLFKELPDPVRRIIGDLSNREQVLLGLDLRRHRSTEDDQGDKP